MCVVPLESRFVYLHDFCPEILGYPVLRERSPGRAGRLACGYCLSPLLHTNITHKVPSDIRAHWRGDAVNMQSLGTVRSPSSPFQRRQGHCGAGSASGSSQSCVIFQSSAQWWAGLASVQPLGPSLQRDWRTWSLSTFCSGLVVSLEMRAHHRLPSSTAVIILCLSGASARVNYAYPHHY